mgnify:FL=1
MHEYIKWFEELGIGDVAQVGGKNASLGEMIQGLTGKGVSVPGGFATTADAYREFLAHNGLADRIYQRLDALDIEDMTALAQTGREIRDWIVETPFPDALHKAICAAYRELVQRYSEDTTFAVRSSATAEDLPEASFAGQQETYLNIQGEESLLHAIKLVFASLFNDRAIAYREHQNFDHRHVALSAGIQKMVRSDLAASGVMFSIDTESGFSDVVFITSAYGLGETVVQGAVNPDEFIVYKPALANDHFAILSRNLGSKAIRMVYNDKDDDPNSTLTEPVEEAQQRRFSLTDEEVQALARQAVIIEQHYGRPMDIEWAKDGHDQQLYIVQARPETVKSQASKNVLQRYELLENGEVIVLSLIHI